jgi:hypothetical protein
MMETPLLREFSSRRQTVLGENRRREVLTDHFADNAMGEGG